MNKTADQKAVGRDGQSGGGGREEREKEGKCQYTKAARMKKMIAVLVREDRNEDGYFKRQSKGNNTL